LNNHDDQLSRRLGPTRGPRLGRSRRQPRSSLEAIRDAGCTCDPDFFMVDPNHIRLEHDEFCLLDGAATREAD
jgi:hypothetical protein